MSALSARKIALLSGAPGPSLDLNFLSGMLDPRITFTRAAGPATYFDATGTLQTAGTNVARFDYDPVTLASRGLLIEEARTNLLLNSASLGTQTVTVAAVANTLRRLLTSRPCFSHPNRRITRLHCVGYGDEREFGGWRLSHELHHHHRSIRDTGNGRSDIKQCLVVSRFAGVHRD